MSGVIVTVAMTAEGRRVAAVGCTGGERSRRGAGAAPQRARRYPNRCIGRRSDCWVSVRTAASERRAVPRVPFVLGYARPERAGTPRAPRCLPVDDLYPCSHERGRSNGRSADHRPLAGPGVRHADVRPAVRRVDGAAPRRGFPPVPTETDPPADTCGVGTGTHAKFSLRTYNDAKRPGAVRHWHITRESDRPRQTRRAGLTRAGA